MLCGLGHGLSPLLAFTVVARPNSGAGVLWALIGTVLHHGDANNDMTVGQNVSLLVLTE